MATEIKMLTLGMAATNCYIIGDTETNEAILIDPVDDAQLLKKTADDAGWTIKLILATHAHFDHVLASKALKDLTGAPFWIHEDCLPMLENLPHQGVLFGMGKFPQAATPDKLLTSASQTIIISSIELQTLYTPGHAPGHLSFYMPARKMVFSGDTLFFSSIGRTDLQGANHERLLQSIREQLFPLGDDITVLPGHMRQTTIGFERQNNPFL